jgi:hypothetical protein
MEGGKSISGQVRAGMIESLQFTRVKKMSDLRDWVKHPIFLTCLFALIEVSRKLKNFENGTPANPVENSN